MPITMQQIGDKVLIIKGRMYSVRVFESFEHAIERLSGLRVEAAGTVHPTRPDAVRRRLEAQEAELTLPN